MAITLIAYFSRAGQNYSHGSIRDLPVGNTEGLAINGDDVQDCDRVVEKWLKKIGLK